MAWRFRTFRLWSYVSGAWVACVLALFGFSATKSFVVWPSEIFWLPAIVLSVPLVLLLPCWAAMWSSDRAKGIEPPYWPTRRMIFGAVLVAILIGSCTALAIEAQDRERHTSYSITFGNGAP